MKKTRMFMTGSNGTIGHILIKAFKDKYELFLADKRPMEEKNQNFILLNICNFDETLKAMKSIGKIDVVIHLAADPRVDAPWNSVIKNNIIGTYNVFEASRRVGVKKIIFASSNHATGMYENVEPPLYEREGPAKISVDMPARPDGFYAISKLFGENLGRYYSERYGIAVLCLRIGSLTSSNDPTTTKRFRSAFLFHEDLVQLVEKCIENKKIKFGVFYGVSDNTRSFWDISNAKRLLGYKPKCNAEDYFK